MVVEEEARGWWDRWDHECTAAWGGCGADLLAREGKEAATMVVRASKDKPDVAMESDLLERRRDHGVCLVVVPHQLMHE